MQTKTRFLGRRLAWLTAAATMVLLLVTSALAQVVGTVASLDGEVGIERGGNVIAAEPGIELQQGDIIRTGEQGRVRLLLQDDTVLNLGAGSTLTLDAQELGSATAPPQSVLGLLSGMVRVLVSEYYTQPGAQLEVKTPTAVSGVRGTEFVVAYDTNSQATEVVGISGKVEVNGVADLGARGVFVQAREITKVDQGGVPSKPRRLADDLFRQYLDGLAFIGRGQPEGATFESPFLGNEFVPPVDRVETVAQAAAAEGHVPPAVGGGGSMEPIGFDDTPVIDVSDLIGQPPAAAATDTGEIGIRF